MPKVKQQKPDVPFETEHETPHHEVANAMVRMGHTVTYYENGDKAQKPQIAIVSDVTATGLCLHVLTPRGMMVRDFIKHVDDPWFESRPKTLREAGAWDTLHQGQRRLDEEARLRQAAVLRRQQAEEANRQAVIDEIPLMDEVAMAAEELARQGFALPDIATQLRGQATVGQLVNHFETHSVSA